MQEYFAMLYEQAPTDRIFPVTKSFLHHEMDRGSKMAGVKKIRIHDLRHSHISALIDLEFSAVAIADRVGHESIDITYRYSHLFPSKQVAMADKLDKVKAEFEESVDEIEDCGMGSDNIVSDGNGTHGICVSEGMKLSDDEAEISDRKILDIEKYLAG